MSEADEHRAVPKQLADDRFRAVLDAMFDEVAIGVAVRDDDGTIVDFEMVYLNAATLDGAGRSAEDLIGRRVCESFPGWAESGLLERYARVVETGVPYVAERLAYEGTTPDGAVIDGYWSMSVAKFGDGYITATRDVTAAVAAEAEQRAIAREAERNEMAADLLRRAALPTSLPSVRGVELAARYESAGDAQPVGGDWYDALDLGDGRLGLVIADVTGHGPDAAAFMVQVRNIVRALAFEHREPDVVLTQANRIVALIDEPGLYATCCVAALAPEAGTLTWASAGHFAPLRVPERAGRAGAAVGPPLGVQPDVSYRAEVLEVAPGDLLVLFTDGLVEERGRDLDDGLSELAAATTAWVGRSADDVADALVRRANDRSDDVALLCVRFTSPS